MERKRGAMGRLMLLIGAIAALITPTVHALTVQEMCRLQGHGESVVWGYGLVMGLPGTGDKSGNKEREQILAKLGQTAGSPVAELASITNAKNVALVQVSARIPREGAKTGDRLDVHVMARYDATSLKGGRLFITPLQDPVGGQRVYAYAEGAITLDDETTPTTGRVTLGAQIAEDIEMNVIAADGTLTLDIEPQYAGWTTSKLIANSINQDRAGLAESAAEIARAIDAKSVVVHIPAPELANPANFIGDIMSIRLEPSLLNLPARVIINEKRESIVIARDVEIGGVAIAHKDLVITELVPPREPTPEQPLVTRTRWTTTGTQPDERTVAKLTDLVRALRQLDVPVRDQIDILTKMQRAGMLHAQIITE